MRMHLGDFLRHSPKTMFVLDDWPDVIDLFKRTGEKNGVNVIGAVSNDDARTKLEKISKKSLLMAFIDVEIGTESGVDIFRLIRSTMPRLPMVIMTGRPSHDSLVDLIATDPYASFLSKPFFMEEITEYIRNPCRKTGDIRELVELTTFLQESDFL